MNAGVCCFSRKQQIISSAAASCPRYPNTKLIPRHNRLENRSALSYYVNVVCWQQRN